MQQLHNSKLPFSLHEDFIKLNEIHSHNTRQSQNAVFYKLPEKMQCLLSRYIEVQNNGKTLIVQSKL